MNWYDLLDWCISSLIISFYKIHEEYIVIHYLRLPYRWVSTYWLKVLALLLMLTSGYISFNHSFLFLTLRLRHHFPSVTIWDKNYRYWRTNRRRASKDTLISVVVDQSMWYPYTSCPIFDIYLYNADVSLC